MGRKAAIFWHAALSAAAGVLYFFFVLPRWPELMGDTSHGLGTALRIVAGLLIALAALPVVFTLLRSRRPEFGTPALALNLRTGSTVAHVTAGVLIVGTAISEIWLNLDSVGQWLFGVYGAAAAIALLGVGGFLLSFVAESPPPPPKPIKPKRERRQRRRRGTADDTGTDEPVAETDDAGESAEQPEESAGTAAEPDDTARAESPADEAAEPEAVAPDTEATDDATAAEEGGLRNKRPSGKVSGRRRRTRRGTTTGE